MTKVIKRFGPQAPVEGLDYYDCGICGHFHPLRWDGDCRDDANRYSIGELDDKHGPHGWHEVDMPTC